MAGVINAVVDEEEGVLAAAFGPPDTVHDLLIESSSRDCVASIERPADIAIAGVPFDMGVNFRSGARHGPAAVRGAARRIPPNQTTTGRPPDRPPGGRAD